MACKTIYYEIWHNPFAVCQGSCHLKFSFKQPHLELLVAAQQGSNKPYQHDPNS